MKSSLFVTLILALAVIGGGIFLINRLMAEKYNSGFQAATIECQQSAVKGAANAKKIYDKKKSEIANVSDDVLDDELRRLGIMRTDTDR